MRIHISLSITGLVTLAIIGSSAYALPSAPPAGSAGYTGGIFAHYFQNIIEGDGTIGTTTAGECPDGEVIIGFSVAPATYGLPLCGTATSPQYWSSTDTGASIYFTGVGNVAIGKTVGTAKLDVNGDILVNGVTVGKGSGSLYNTVVGVSALNSNITGSNNVAIGNNALQNATSAWYNVAVGQNALLSQITGGYNTANGISALSANTTGEYNTAIGGQALVQNIAGSYNTAVGLNSSFWTTGSYNTTLGYMAGSSISSGGSNIAIGNSAQVPSNTASNQLSIGNWIYGDNGNIGIGTGTALAAKLTVAGPVQIIDGSQGSGKVLTSDANGLGSWMSPSEMPIGAVVAFNTATCPTGWTPANGSGTIDLRGEFIRGLDSGRGVDTGRVLGSAQAQDWKSFYMQNTLQNVSAGYSHVAVWMGKSTTSYVGNLFTGYWSNPSASIGTMWDTLSEVRPRNVALLYCTKISGATTALSSNVTWSNITGTSTGDVTLATTGNVGIGTTGPTAKLEVNGQIKITGGGPGTSKVLTSDANGLASWSAPASGTANFGQLQAHATYTDCNTLPANWGWTFVQGSTNCPNTTSTQWYRGMFSLGSDYPSTGASGFRMELAYPRFNAATAGTWMRTMESGVIGPWTQLGGGTQWITNGANIYRSTGNVGIGTTAPGTPLEISSTSDNIMRLRQQGGGWNYLEFYNDTIRTAYLGMDNGNNLSLNGQLFVNNVTNNIGIGTTTPNNKLSIVGVSSTGDDTLPALGANGGKFAILNGGGSGLYGLLQGVLGNGNAFLQAQRVDGTATPYSILLNPNGGNVGIGTTSPTAKLEINGQLKIDSSGTSVFSLRSAVASSNYGTWQRADATGAIGYIGGALGAAVSGGTANDFVIRSPAGNIVIYPDTGNVGIGTTSPTAKLHIVGKAVSLSTTGSDIGTTLVTKDYVDARLSGMCTIVGGTWNNTTGACTIPILYSWQIGTYGACSASCGGGTQTTTIVCKQSNGVIVADSLCAGTKPSGASVSCNTQACPVNCSYTTTGWSACSASCGGGTQSYYYTITAAAQNGGTCAVSQGQVAGTQSCNTQSCITYSYVGQSGAAGGCGAIYGGYQEILFACVRYANGVFDGYEPWAWSNCPGLAAGQGHWFKTCSQPFDGNWTYF